MATLEIKNADDDGALVVRMSQRLGHPVGIVSWEAEISNGASLPVGELQVQATRLAAQSLTEFAESLARLFEKARGQGRTDDHPAGQ